MPDDINTLPFRDRACRSRVAKKFQMPLDIHEKPELMFNINEERNGCSIAKEFNHIFQGPINTHSKLYIELSWSTRHVVGQVDRLDCAIRNCWEQWTREDTHAQETGSGSTRKTTRREDRMIVGQALVVLTMTSSTIRADVGVEIVPQTISRHLAEANLKSKLPFHALPLTPEHRQMRLQWCQARSMWNVIDWQEVVLSDESRFVLGTDDNRVRVWRRPGERGKIFQQDNARPLSAKVAQDSLRHFQTLPWPARSPDLSPVEHVGDQLKLHMPSCHSVHDLELVVQDLWAHLCQDNIRCLINSIPDRVAACTAAAGGPRHSSSCPVFAHPVFV
ncbi:transposable element Tc1 transposase [Trichonephila clavipes]|nr:transposable element Tc1 transposase [Trichonephila clavipes]